MILELKRIRLQTLARILSGKKLYLRFGNSSYTDLKTITLNSFEKEIVPGVKASKAECWISQKAVCAHEAGHIRFTAQKYIEKASSYNRLMPFLLNIVEDSRIERCMSNTYSGCFAWFRFLNDYIFKNRPNWGTGPQALLNGLITYAVVGRLPDDIIKQPEIIDLIEKCSPHIDTGREANHTEGAWQETLKIWEIIEKYVGSFIPSDQPPIVGTTTPEEAAIGPIDPRRKPKLPKVETKPEDHDTSEEPENDDPLDKPGDIPPEDSDDPPEEAIASETPPEEPENPDDSHDEPESSDNSPEEQENLEDPLDEPGDSDNPPEDYFGEEPSNPDNPPEEPDGFDDSPEESSDLEIPEELENFDDSPEELSDPDIPPEEPNGFDGPSEEPGDPDTPPEETDGFDGLPEELSDSEILSGKPEGSDSPPEKPKELDDFSDEPGDADYDGLLDEAHDELSDMESSADRSVKSKPESEPVPVTEEELMEELSKGIHKGVVFKTRSSRSSKDQKRRYQELHSRVKPFIGKTVTEVKRILEYKASIKEANLQKGRLNTNSLWKLGVKDTRLFYRIQEPGNIPKIAVYLLVDCSGSMVTGNKIPRTQEAACLLYETCTALNIPIKITGFTGAMRGAADSDVTHINFVDFEEKDTKQNITLINALNENRDGYSIRVATKELESRLEEQKVLIVLSDGMPLMPYNEYIGKRADKDTALAVREAQKKGLGVIGLYFGDERFLSQAQLIYNDMVFVKQVETLPQQVARVLKKTTARL